MITFDIDLMDKSAIEVFGSNIYQTYKFTYGRIYRYHHEEHRILGDLQSISPLGINYASHAVVVFYVNTKSKVLTHQTLSWIATQINARFILLSNIIYTQIHKYTLKKHQLEIIIHMPSLEK